MIVIHGKSVNKHCVGKSTSRLLSALPEAEANKSVLKGSEIDSELVSAHKKIKSVRFADIDESYECDQSEEEMFTTWLTKLEISTIQESNKKTADLVEKGLSFTARKDLCARGLEHRSPERFRERRSNRRKALQGVLEEQNRHPTDNEKIATIYKTFVSQCQQDALGRGFADAKDAAAIASHRSLPSIRGVSAFLRRSPPTRTMEHKVFGENQDILQLSSMEAEHKLESGSSASRCRVAYIKHALAA